MNALSDLIVPGEGSVVDVLSTIEDQCGGMKEARQVCQRLHTHLVRLFDALHAKNIDGDLPTSAVLDKYVTVTAEFLLLLQRYTRQELVYRVLGHSTMTDELRQIYEEVAELFFELDIERTSSWGGDLSEAYRLLEVVLSTSVKSSALVLRELQNPRARVEALLTLKYELAQRGERHDDTILVLMSSMLAALMSASRAMETQLPGWFLPLSEVEFEAKPFGCGTLGPLHRGCCGEQSNVVIKFLSVHGEAMDDCELHRLEKSLHELAELDHPNVLKLVGASHVSSPPFVVSEYAANGSLSSFLCHSDEHRRHLWRLLYQGALGLEYIHSKGIVHNDLQLKSFLVDACGHVKLSGVGLSVRGASTGLRWRAPECLKRRPTAASNVYSFAMCMIEAVIGEPPFAFLADDDVRDNVRKGEIPDRPEEMGEAAWELIVSMTNFDPAKRVDIQCVIAKLKMFGDLEHAGQEEGSGSPASVKLDGPNAPDEAVRNASSPHCGDIAGLLSSNRSSDSSEEQEVLLQRLGEACIEDEKRRDLYEADGIAVLTELFKSGRSHFTQVTALLCLSWAVQLDSILTKQAFELLRSSARGMTSDELTVVESWLRDGDDAVKAKGAMYCAGAGTATKGEELGEAELLRQLVTLLRHGADNVKLWAAIALAKLANNDTNRINLANEGAIAPLLVLLQSGTKTQKLWATCALAKVGQDTEVNSDAIANCGAIPLLMELLHNETDRQREFAALALGHLALASNRSCILISNAGAITPLVSLLRSGNGRQKERAGFCVGALMSRSVDNCTALEVEGGVELLVSLLKTGTDGQRESAAFALGTFVACGDVKSNEDELEDAITYLISLLSTGSATQQELAALTLGTFSAGSGMSSLAGALEKAVSPLLDLLRVGASGQQDQTSFALSHLAGTNEAIRAVMVREGAIPTLVSLLQTGSDVEKEHAARGLGNLAVNNVAHSNEVAQEGAMPLLIELLRSGTDKHKMYAALAVGSLTSCSSASRTAIANGGGIPLLMTLLRSGKDEMKEAAVFALARLALSEANGVLMVHDGAIPLLVELLQSGIDRQKEQAAFALSELADKNYQNCEAIACEGGISPLVALLSAGTDKQKEYAAMALSFICGEDEFDDYRVAISRAGAISPLVSLVGSGTDPQKRWAALALGSLAVKDDANCAVIAREGAIPPLIALLRSAIDRQKENAAFALGRLAAYSEDKDIVTALEEAIPPLAELLRSGSDAQKEEAAFALGHISQKDEASSESIAKHGAIKLLVELLRSGTDKQKAYATMALVNLAAHNRSVHADVMHEGVLGLLVQLERTGTEAQKKWAAYSLGRLAFKSHVH
jgi:serine/threonine protein kinase/HEAT repeat protein